MYYCTYVGLYGDVIICNFCGSPIYPTVSQKIENLRPNSTPKMTNPLQRRIIMSSRSRMMSCLCRKPLPKCSICRRHFGSQIEPEVPTNNNGVIQTISPIDHWFVWCCSCNHGGHLLHMKDWFKEYLICPINECDCLCLSRDAQLRDELLAAKSDKQS